MSFSYQIRRHLPSMVGSFSAAALAATLVVVVGCAPSTTQSNSGNLSVIPSTPDPRVGLRGGAYDAQEAVWNLNVLSKTKPSEKFISGINSDLAFSGNYVIQGSFNGYQVWDISNPKQPTLRTAYFCPASQSDVSVYKNLLFVSGEDLTARIDCGAQGVKDTVSKDRLRGIRIFDISDIANPRNVGNVQTCRGSHTHSLLVDPKDPANVYVYISGSAGVALMFLERYRHDRDPRDLVTARRLLDWVNEQAVAARSGGLRWPLATDQPSSASGFELGVAGIAWVNLRAARATGDARYLE